MSRFYFQWQGNKRLELPRLDVAVDWSKFETVVEPFAGSAALTLELHSRGLGKRHVVNDCDPHLVELLQYIAANGSEPLYEYCRSRLTPEEFYAHHKAKPADPFAYFYTRRVLGDAFRTAHPPKKWPTLVKTKRQASTDAAFAAATITRGDWRDCVDAYKDDPKSLIFLDPPYFNSFNQEYYGLDRVKVHPDGRIADGTTLFLEMLEYLETAAATIVVITNSCAIIDHLFAKFIHSRYHKAYAKSVKIGDVYVRKSTNHLLLIGGGMPPEEKNPAAGGSTQVEGFAAELDLQGEGVLVADGNRSSYTAVVLPQDLDSDSPQRHIPNEVVPA